MKKVLKMFAMFMVFVVMFTSTCFAVDSADIGLGDINGDGRVSAVDALFVLHNITGKVCFTEEQSALADCNFDGTISVVDALIVLRLGTGEASIIIDDFSGDLSEEWDIVSGNWIIEDETLVQDAAGDGILLRNGLQSSNQIVSVNLCASLVGACNGVILWYQDDCNFIAIKLCPQIDRIWIEEKVSGLYSYTSYRAILDYNEWYEFKVNTDNSGIKVYLNNNLAITYTASTPNRFGSIGLVSAGASYDGFKLLY